MSNAALSPLVLKEITVVDLDPFANPSDLRRDIHTFVDYVRDHEIKRGHRGNAIPRSHQERLAKLMDAAAPAVGDNGDAGSPWVEHVDAVCLALKFVHYSTEGEYAGYSSMSRSYPENYIQLKEPAYRTFLGLSLQAQEEVILDVHMQGINERTNEFFTRGPLTRSEPFDRWASATGIVPHIRFAKIRRALLELLARCPVGVWLSTASLIEHLRLTDPWFMIPKELPSAVRKDSPTQGRYGNFIEHKREDWGNRNSISDHDPDGFAKVEGRYLERFLEGIPLALGYVEVAYMKGRGPSEIVPDRGLLAAFRVTERLARVLHKAISPPRVTVLPNFEIHVESLFFSADAENKLQPLCDLVHRGVATVFKLTKTKVAATLADHPNDEPVATLEALTGRPLPANVKQEMTEWAGYSDKFVLYEGFGLLEGERNNGSTEHFVVEAISPKFALVRGTTALYEQLETAEQVPVRLRHKPKAFSAPAGVKSALATADVPQRVREKTPVKIRRSVQTTLWFTDAPAHAAFCDLLLDAKCVVPMDRRALTVRYTRKEEPVVRECLKKFNQENKVSIDDMES